jgi:hypothetical protein
VTIVNGHLAVEHLCAECHAARPSGPAV